MVNFFRPGRALRYLAPILIILCCLQLKATTTYVGTMNNASSWTLTYDGPSGDVSGDAMQLANGQTMSLSSTGTESGTFTGAGGTLTSAELATAFNGVWEGNLDFVLPANAIDVVLTFSNLVADDRVVLGFNGVGIGNAGLSGTTDATGIMSFVLNSPTSTTPQDFNADTAGMITTGFDLGGTNDLQFFVNNTNAAATMNGSNLAAPSQGFQTSSDGTVVGFDATISFQTAVPEPAPFFLFGAAMMWVLGILQFRRGHRTTRRRDTVR
jgi:hypothetical protein